MVARVFVLKFGVFFFSSRRRHTRWTGDWSSDVCSSDLEDRAQPHRNLTALNDVGGWAGVEIEERRVGKECRPRGAPYHQKKEIGTPGAQSAATAPTPSLRIGASNSPHTVLECRTLTAAR